MSQFSWDDPGVTNLLDAYIQNVATGNVDVDDPTIGSARSIANTLIERYSDPTITRHMVHHQIKKRRRFLSNEHSLPRILPPKVETTFRNSSYTQSEGRRSSRLRGSPPPGWFINNNSTSSNVASSSTTPKRSMKTKPSQTTNVNNVLRQTTPRAQRRQVPSDSTLQNEIIMTLQRVQALIDAQITLTLTQTAAYDQRNSNSFDNEFDNFPRND